MFEETNSKGIKYKYFYVQRGDGTRYEYSEDRIEWSKLIRYIDIEDLTL